MITLSEIWDILVMKMPRGWVSLHEIYGIVQQYHKLDDDDYQPESPRSARPKWERNVRNVLQYRRKTGHVEWDYYGKYRMKSINFV